MTNSEKQENRNTLLYAVGLAMMIFGVICSIIGATYMVLHANVGQFVAYTDNSWMQAVSSKRHDTFWVGILLTCIGIFFQRRADDAQTALEHTNRPVSYDTLMAKRSARR